MRTAHNNTDLAVLAEGSFKVSSPGHGWQTTDPKILWWCKIYNEQQPCKWKHEVLYTIHNKACMDVYAANYILFIFTTCMTVGI